MCVFRFLMKPCVRWRGEKGDGMGKAAVLKALEIEGEQQGAGTGSWLACNGDVLQSTSPINGEIIGTIRSATVFDYERVIARAVEAFEVWRRMPAPKRGEIVRQIGNAMRERKREVCQWGGMWRVPWRCGGAGPFWNWGGNNGIVFSKHADLALAQGIRFEVS